MSQRHCSHDFICIRQMVSPDTPSIVVCHYCGQVKHIFTDGVINIIRDEGIVNRNPDGKITS